MPKGRPETCKAPYRDGEKELKCQLPKGHPTSQRHGPRPVVVIPQDQFVIEDVDEKEVGDLRRKRVERSEQQKAVDELIWQRLLVWREAGRPDTWIKQGKAGAVKVWKIDTRFEEKAVSMLHNGANKHGVKVVIGDIDRKTIAGKSRIPFVVTDRPEKTTPEAPALPEPVAAATTGGPAESA